MSEVQKKAMQTLREAGYAVVTWSPEELGNVDAKRVEGRCVEFGNEVIKDVQ